MSHFVVSFNNSSLRVHCLTLKPVPHNLVVFVSSFLSSPFYHPAVILPPDVWSPYDSLPSKSVLKNLKLHLPCVPSHFSWVWLFATPWTIAHQAPLSMGCSRQEYWSGLPCLPPGDLPNPGTELPSLVSPALADGFFTISATWENFYLL